MSSVILDVQKVKLILQVLAKAEKVPALDQYQQLEGEECLMCGGGYGGWHSDSCELAKLKKYLTRKLISKSR